MKKLIYSKEDLDLILCLEIEKYEDKINNLQSKIDKAIEYINNNLTTSSILDGKKIYCLNDYSFDYEELLDILKEDK